MWASVGPRGDLESGYRVKSIESRSTGVYDVVFEGRLEGCAVHATARGGDPILATIEAGDDRATVHLFDLDAKPVDGGFDIAALCGEQR